MFRHLIVLFLILLTNFSFGQIVLTQTHSDATIGLDRKAWAGLGNTSGHSDGYAHDFTLPASTNPCQQITGIRVEINHTGYTNNNVCPHAVTYYNLFYGCTSYTGGATCLPASNLLAEPNYAPNTSPPPFNFGNPLGSPLNSNIVPDFGDNLSIDIIPVSNPGCNPVTNGHISYQYTITVTVTVTDLPPTSPTFTQVPAICSGDTLTALPTTSNNSITGTWSPALDNSTTTTYTFTPDAGQCAATETMTITVITPVTPTFTQVAGICDGDILTALPTTSNNSISGIWSPALDNTATTTYTFTPDAGQCGSTETMTITVSTSVTPNFTQVPGICDGDILTALPTTSNNSITGTWSPALDNTTTTTYTFTPDAGQCAATQTMTITVSTPVTPTFTQVAAICDGDILTALPTTSNNSISGIWSPALDNTATTTYTFTPDVGQCATTETMTITVNTPVTPTFTQVAAICDGDTLTALPTTSNNSITGTWSPALDNTAITTYTFTPDIGQCAVTETMTITVSTPVTPTFTQVAAICDGDTLTALPTTSNNSITGAWSPALDNTTTTTYTFTPDAGQCAATETMTITVNTPVAPTFNQVAAICDGDTLSALPTTSNNSITGTWSPALDNTATTTYTFTPDIGQCATTQTMTITVNAQVTPTFTQVPAICSGDNLSALPRTSNNSITGTWSPALDNTTTTTYTFTPDAGQCATTQTMTITVNPMVTPTFTQVSDICNGDTLSPLPTTSNEGITGTWSPALDNTNTTTYTFTPDAGQCAFNQTMTITVNPISSPTFAQVTAICNGDTLSPLPTTSNEGVTGTWSPSIDNTITTTYTFTPDPGFCPSPVSLTIEVFENPIISLQNEYFLCFNLDGTIALPVTIDTGLNTSGYNFTWLLNGVSIIGASQGTYMPIEGGNYEVIVQNVMTTCESSMTTLVTASSEPDFEAEVITAAFSENQTIQVTTINSGDFEYRLDDGPWQDEPIFNNVFSGEHLVTVRNTNGCIESGKTVVVIGYPKFFTPNNDGYHDRWNINGIANQTSARINIFNRYGKFLKQINPAGEGWSGIFNGRLMPVDDYWFTVEYNDASTGERKMFKAHFTLKR